MIPATTENAAPAAPQAPATPAASAPAAKKAKQSKSPAKKAKKAKKVEKQLADSAFLALLLQSLYAVRNKSSVKWNDFRLASKEFDTVDKLIKQRPNYVWRQVGTSHYLEAKHDGSDTVVAYILVHDPVAAYKKELAAYQTWLAKPKSKKGKTVLKEPAKPESRKKTFHWHIANKKGVDENNGHSPTLQEATDAVFARKSQFYV
jgi:hypothetical protein